MRTRGRQSAEAQVAEKVLADKASKPDAPYDLTDEQSTEWWAVVNRMPADWFQRETFGLLTQHCRLVTRLRRVAQLLNQLETSDKPLEIVEYRALLRTEAELTRALSMVDTKMRLSQQSSYDKKKVRAAVKMRKPWDA